MREAGYCVDPHTAVALAVAEKETRDPSVPMVVLSTAHPAKFPDAVEAACGVTPGAAGLAGRSAEAAGARHRAAGRSGGRSKNLSRRRRVRRVKEQRHDCRSDAPCLRPVGRHRRMPHLETASLGVWVGSGSRDEKPDEHGISHLLEHMAFKGTKRRTARQIAEEIEAVGGDLNAATSVETTGYYARVLKADVPLALDVLSDILSDPTFDPEELQARAERHRAGDRRDRRCAGRSGVRPFAGDRVSRISRSAARSSARRKPCARSMPTSLRAYLARNYRGARHGGRGRRRGRSRADRRRGRKAFRELHGPGRADAGAGAFRRRHARRDRAISSRSTSRWRWKACRCAIRQLYSLQVFTSVLGGGMSSRLFQEVREKRGLCYSIHAFHMPYSDTGMFGLYAGTDEADAPELMRVVIDQIGNATETLNETEIDRAKAQMKAGLLMALESSEARARAAGAADAGLWPADPARRDRRQGRCRHGRKRARRRPRADRARPAGDRRARPRQRT